jgi:DNA-binding MarR family transcriptional regulator
MGILRDSQVLDRSGSISEQGLSLRTRRCREELRIFVRLFGGQMTVNQLLVLCSVTLGHLEGRRCTVQQIAWDEDICQQTVSGCVRRLESYALVLSTPAAEDRRVHLLNLTEKAIALHAEAHAEILSKNLEIA